MKLLDVLNAAVMVTLAASAALRWWLPLVLVCWLPSLQMLV